jgi:hypothetical protein
VILNEPQSIDFEEVVGPFAVRKEHISLTEMSVGTHIIYEANIGLKGWVLGWLLGMLFVRPRLKYAVQEHFKKIKEIIKKSN